jgi:TRAP transporter TAXI family solute receptor
MGGERPEHQMRLLIVCLVIAVAGCSAAVPPERDLLIATATTGGTFYPAGVAMATLLTQTLGEREQILASAITSAGSAENVNMLAGGEVQLAILQGLIGAMAWEGTGVYEGRSVRELRGLAMLWENVEQAILLRRFAPTGTIADLAQLRGQRLSIGPRWSGTEISARTMLGALGIEPGEHFEPVHLEYGPSADALMNRRLVGMFLGAGIPTGAFTQAMAALGEREIVMLEFTDEQLATLRERYPVWERFVIPAHTYPGQHQPVRTIAQPNVLASSRDVDHEVIYLVVRTIWQHLETLHRHHAATRSMRLERAVQGLPVPLHAGAVRFYREVGLEIPDALLPPELSD